jgi:hypothetical protein
MPWPGVLPTGQAARQALAEQIGADGLLLLRLAYAPEAPAWLREVPAVEALRRIWVQQYAIADGNLRWRTGEDELPPPATFISSPHDQDMHFARKREAHLLMTSCTHASPASGRKSTCAATRFSSGGYNIGPTD